jgi:hypothetical protein
MIVIEDTHTSFPKDFAAHGERSFLNRAQDCPDLLTARSRSMYPDRFKNGTNIGCTTQFYNVSGIKFFSSLAAFQAHAALATGPELLWNKPADSVAAFKYKGVNSALVDWPDPFTSQVVLVKGQKRLSGFGAMTSQGPW